MCPCRLPRAPRSALGARGSKSRVWPEALSSSGTGFEGMPEPDCWWRPTDPGTRRATLSIATIKRTSVRRLPKEVSNNEDLPGTWLRFSTVLYLDGAPRYFQDFECSGTQSWRRVHGQTAEILHKSEAGAW